MSLQLNEARAKQAAEAKPLLDARKGDTANWEAATYDSLGLKCKLFVPSTVESFDQNARKPGACRLEAVNNVVYRGPLAEFRDLTCEQVEAITGIARKTRQVELKEKNADGSPKFTTVYDESEMKYAKRVMATKGWNEEQWAKEMQPLADEVSDLIVFDASATERQGTKMAKKYIEAAEGLLPYGQDIVRKACTKMAEFYGGTVPDGDLSVEQVASIIKSFKEKEEEGLTAKLLGLAQ